MEYDPYHILKTVNSPKKVQKEQKQTFYNGSTHHKNSSTSSRPQTHNSSRSYTGMNRQSMKNIMNTTYRNQPRGSDAPKFTCSSCSTLLFTHLDLVEHTHDVMLSLSQSMLKLNLSNHPISISGTKS